MHRHKTALLILVAVVGLASAAPAKDFSGTRAMDYARKVVSFGPRPPGSAALRNLRAYILAQLKLDSCEVKEDAFTGQTPGGPIPMVNIIARFPGKSGRAVVFSGHYDTKKMAGVRFVGADDGGSSTAFLLEMAEALRGAQHRDDIYLVWFDGEEAFGEWSATDSVYGSRHLAERWAADNTIGKIRAFFLVDMIGDKDLDILDEESSSRELHQLVWSMAQRLGYGKYFLDSGGPVDDDHMPFVKMGVNAVDLIDFDKTYWHTPNDTIDKLSAHSFDVVGMVLMAALGELEK
ncbi:MAG: M28 family peptidase [Bryobacteraceae bacterium]|jgi:Zn-dependent M28 family amino/carboxypeptidase